MIGLAVIIVNFRTPALTVDCLASLEMEIAAVDSAGLGPARVIVVDNGSGDGSAAIIESAIAGRRWEAWARVVACDRNGGFAWGNNRGIEAAGPARRVLLLNSDTIVRAGCLVTCVRILDADASIGVLSCKLLNADGSVQNVARRFPTPARLVASAAGLPWKLPRLFGWADTEDPGWDRTCQARDVDWLGGAFMLVPGPIIEAIGGLDESFFFYGEDIEFCWRVRRLGKRCRYDPCVSITHLGGSSSDPTRMPAKARSVHAWRGRYRVQRLCYGRMAAWVVRMADLAGYAGRLAWLRLRGRGDGERARQLGDIVSILRKPLGQGA